MADILPVVVFPADGAKLRVSMSDPDQALHKKVIFPGARIIAFILLPASLFAAFNMATRPPPIQQMEARFRWGLIALFSLIAIVSFLMLRAPIYRR